MSLMTIIGASQALRSSRRTACGEIKADRVAEGIETCIQRLDFVTILQLCGRTESVSETSFSTGLAAERSRVAAKPCISTSTSNLHNNHLASRIHGLDPTARTPCLQSAPNSHLISRQSASGKTKHTTPHRPPQSDGAAP